MESNKIKQETVKMEDINPPAEAEIKMEDLNSEAEEELDNDNGSVEKNDDGEHEETKANGKNGKGKKAAPKSPATPRKRGRKPAAQKNTDATGDDAENEESPTKKKRASPKTKTGENGEKAGKVNARTLPTSYEDASEADRMLLRMKDTENKSWAEIREAWETMTGDKVGGSTLSGRYGRIKANFTVFPKDDDARLLNFKKELEEEWEREKWTRLADRVEKDGGSKYGTQVLQKRYKELSKQKAGASITNKAEADNNGA